MERDFYIIRGLPGSGKSTLAKNMMHLYQYNTIVHAEADMYFYKDGVYQFDQSKLAQAHYWCYNTIADALEMKKHAIVSNTFTTQKELKPYFELARNHNIVPTVLLCQTNRGSIHSVPDEAMEQMKNRFTTDLQPLFDMLSKPI